MTCENCCIELIDIRKSFGHQQVLKGVNLPIRRGLTTVIVGESGQGKSVLLKHILGLVSPDAGKVMVEGQDITRLRGAALKQMRTRFGVLFQGAALFDSMTVFENIALPLRERTRLPAVKILEKVQATLELLGLEGSEDKYPAQLSGGMKKRVGLARALQLDPEILLFDEPTTGLDPVKSREVYQMFHATQEKLGYTSIIVSHDIPKIFNLADYIALLHNGVIQTCATPEDLQRDENPIVRSFVKRVMGEMYSSKIEDMEMAGGR
ncbi:MAG: ABC transporter ATP-binding protein [Deltaproteobacteria bacterium]|nr:ABC transporter ATP-binding protein [Candidatus Anaeroferrophillus wilburensis]MBN2888159.1 ABC transporter ATP-binding protein [Deltaproteobacteria bacterium]